MYIAKTIILFASFLFANDGPFRGKSLNDVLSGAIPISYSNFISEQYNIPIGQLNAQRGSYLIISPDNMLDHLGELVSFKKSQGFDVYIERLSNIGSTAEEIKQLIENTLLEDPMLEYVLLIGDVDGVAAMPSFYYGPENDVTDQRYTHILGGDFFPDVFIGRFSIDSISELVVMIRKTINYHRQPLSSNADWLDKALVVAGNYSNTVPIPITPKWTSYWVRDLLYDNGFTSVDTVFYPPIQQGASLIQNYINNGVGIVNYRGWGDANGWHYPEFHVGDVVSLNNGWMTPVFTSFVCNSNDFANNVDPCLGEALVRAGTPSNPKGGIAIVGPSDLHTSTKFNNVINAYMFDAMFDNNIVELAPAMNAGLMGLTREFPNLDGAEEAQEFYFHVYNIVGDPSVSMYLTRPNEFSIIVEDVSNNDGYVELSVSTLEGDPVHNAVISLMANDSILFKGNSDINGKFQASINLHNILTIDVYANKSGFIQGKIELEVNNDQSDLVLVGYELDHLNENNLDLGKIAHIYPIFMNKGASTISSLNGHVNISLVENCQIISSNFEIPDLESGQAVSSITPIMVRANSVNKDNIFLNLGIDSQDWNYDFAIPIKPLILETDLIGDELSNNTISELSLLINNYSNTELDSLFIELISLDDSLSISMNSIQYFSISSYSDTEINNINHEFEIGNVSHGSALSYQLSIKKDTIIIYSEQKDFRPSFNDNQPIAPTWYGYWAYDNSDTNYIQSPLFNWVELDPMYGGSGASAYKLDDDDHVTVQLPFEFKYFNRTYNELTINSNGWASFIPCDIDYFYNYTIPMALGPKAVLAPFWDDLEVINDDSIRVFTKYEQNNGRFIIEWSRALNGFDEVTEETFAIYLYNQEAIPTESGDGVIEFHYLDIADIDADKNYSTIGIEDHSKNEGIQYAFNNTYTPGAAQVQNECSIRFTTESPINYVSSLSSMDEKNVPSGFQIFPPYPNPFNPSITISYQLPKNSDVKISIYDLLGNEVDVLLRENRSAGRYNIQWQGIDKFGKSVSSGTYFVVLEALSSRKVQKILFIK